jgi:hypothetical protein
MDRRDLISAQVIELRFNPLEHRDEHGKWTGSGARKILTPGQIKGAGFKAMLPPAAPPVGSRGNRVLDRHIDSQIQHWQEEGLGARVIRKRLADRAKKPDQLGNRLREKGFGSLPPVRPAALKTGDNVTWNGMDARIAAVGQPAVPEGQVHIRVGNAGYNVPAGELHRKGSGPPPLNTKEIAAKEAGRFAASLKAQGHGPETIRQKMRERAGIMDTLGGQLRRIGIGPPKAVPVPRPAEPGTGRWEFIRSGVQKVTRPQVGDKARLKLGAAGNQVGTVVAVAGLVAAVDSGDDDMRYMVDWRNGEVRNKIPLSQAGPALPAFAPPPSPPGVYVAPGTKQLEFPGMPKNDLGSNNPEVRRLAKLASTPEYERARARGHAPHQGNQGTVSILTMPDGTKVLQKVQYSDTRNDAEELSSYVSQVVGAGAPAVARHPDFPATTLVEDFVPGVMADEYVEKESSAALREAKKENAGQWTAEAAASDARDEAEQELYNTTEGYKIGLLDYLISNSDRHNQNWMVTPDGKPVPIDMGYAQFDGQDYESPFTEASGLTDYDPDYGERLDSQEWEELYSGLSAIQPEFQRLGRSGWYSNMMGQLAALNEIEAAKHGLRPGLKNFASVSLQVLDLGFTGWLHEERDIRGRWTHGATVPSEHGQERHGYQGKFMGYDPLKPSMEPADGRKPLSQPGRPDGLGTPGDPIDVKGDMSRAVQLMADSKHVRLNSTDEIKPLLDEVDRHATVLGYSRAHEPKWDLGNISVKGTRLFNEQTRGIPRQDMPQLSGPALPGTEAALLAGGANRFIELDPEFRAQLKRDGIDVRNERVPAGNLRATQTQLTAATVAGITKAAEEGNPKVRHMLKEPIWVTRDNYVIDGHHRWASDEALAFSGHGPHEIEVQRINLPVHLAIPYANQFAQRMGIESQSIGNAKLVNSANEPLSLQVLEFRFDPLELRDRRGRWARSRTEQMSFHKLLRAAATPLVGAPIPNEEELNKAVVAETDKVSHIIPELLHGSHEEWNGKASIFPQHSKDHILAEMEWNGTLNIADNVAAAIKDTYDNPDGPVKYPDAFEVLAHEMIHGVVPEGSAKRNEKAYQVWSLSQIEEGFTELGATQHAAEFFDRMGIGDREARTYPGHTTRQMAETINNPAEIRNGNAWGHYPQQTKDAQDWVEQVAQQEKLDLDSAEGKARILELSDEINRQGADGKVPVMSRQLAEAMLADEPKMKNDQQFLDQMTATIMEAILKQWNTDNPAGAAKQAFGAATTLAHQQVTEKQREMAEAA